jgi:hypothetical protein
MLLKNSAQKEGMVLKNSPLKGGKVLKTDRQQVVGLGRLG